MKIKVQCEKDPFANNITGNDVFVKIFMAIKELIDNAFGAMESLTERIVYIRLFINEKGNPVIEIHNSGTPIHDNQMKKYGDKLRKKSLLCKFGTGTKHASATFGGVCKLYTRVGRRIFCYDITDWMINLNIDRKEISVLDWHPVDESITTYVSFECTNPELADDLRDVSKVNAELIGLCYWPLLNHEMTREVLPNCAINSIKFLDQRENPFNTEYVEVKAPEVKGKLLKVNTRSATIKFKTKEGNVAIQHNGKVRVVTYDFDLSDSKDAEGWLARNKNSQGIWVFAGGSFIEHSGVKVLTQKRNSKKFLEEHDYFNGKITIIDIYFDKDNRDTDLPFENNNKSKVKWDSEAGAQYLKVINEDFGDAYRAIDESGFKERLSQIIEAFMKSFYFNRSDTDKYFINVSMSKFGKKHKGQIDALIATPTNFADIEAGKEPIPDYSQIKTVFKIVGKQHISSGDIYELMGKCVAARDAAGKCPFGTIIVQSSSQEDKELQNIKDAKMAFELVTKNKLNIFCLDENGIKIS